MPTKIEWAEETWNPLTGCTKVSEGCRNCYAERMARRLAGRYGYPQAPRHFDLVGHEDKMHVPFRWRKPRMVFVCSMGDLFHEQIQWPDIERVFMVMVMAKNRRHTFQILTKRAERMREFVTACFPCLPERSPHIWLGISVENQAAADERREALRATPAAVKFVSYEPALARVDWTGWEFIDWLIAGGESGPGARPAHPHWFTGGADWAVSHGIRFFFKQWGAWKPIRPFAPGDEWCQGEMPLNADGTDCRGHEGLADETCYLMRRVGKKKAGRLLEGREWNEMPEGRRV